MKLKQSEMCTERPTPTLESSLRTINKLGNRVSKLKEQTRQRIEDNRELERKNRIEEQRLHNEMMRQGIIPNWV